MEKSEIIAIIIKLFCAHYLCRSLPRNPTPLVHGAVGAQGMQQQAPAPPNPLAPNGVLWREVDAVPLDVGRFESPRAYVTQFNWDRLFTGGQPIPPEKEPIHYFDLLFWRMPIIQEMITHTAARIINDPHRTGPPHFSEEELRKLIGLYIRKINLGVTDINSCWQVNSTDDHPGPPLRFGATYGVSKHQFETWDRNLCWWHGEPPNDPWYRVRVLVDSFNECRLDVVSPGSHLVIDESIIMWYGHHGTVRFQQIPYKAFIRDKPRPEGIHLKNVGDGDTKVFLRLELQEGKIPMQEKQFQIRNGPPAQYDVAYQQAAAAGELYKFHTAVVLRLLQPWFQSFRIAFVDSFFGSLATALALINHGLHLIGMVKKAKSGYPMDFFNGWKDSFLKNVEDGKYKALLSTYHLRGGDAVDHDVMAMGYICEHKLNTLVCTTGTTELGTPYHAYQRRVLVPDPHHQGEFDIQERHVDLPRPKVHEEYRAKTGVIDNHNQLRQGSLHSEELMKTQKFWKRALISLVMICVVDAYYTYCYEEKQKHRHPALSLRAFVNKICKSLCPEVVPYESQDGGPTPQQATQIAQQHTLKPINEHPKFAGRGQNHARKKLCCRVCHLPDAYHYCVKCSDEDHVFAVHSPLSEQHASCFGQHLFDSCAAGMEE